MTENETAAGENTHKQDPRTTRFMLESKVLPSPFLNSLEELETLVRM